MHRPSTRPQARSRRKAVLFCPDCGHESPPDGDWHVRSSTAGTDYTCPACGARVTTRPGDPPVADADPDRSWGAVLGRALRLTLAWSAVPYAAVAPNPRWRASE